VAGGGEDLGLVQSRNRQPGGAVVSLKCRYLRRLVRLAVRPELDAGTVDTCRHLLDVRDQLGAVDEERRGLDGVQRGQSVHAGR
jgi:hypothetical protein